MYDLDYIGYYSANCEGGLVAQAGCWEAQGFSCSAGFTGAGGLGGTFGTAGARVYGAYGGGRCAGGRYEGVRGAGASRDVAPVGCVRAGFAGLEAGAWGERRALAGATARGGGAP